MEEEKMGKADIIPGTIGIAADPPAWRVDYAVTRDYEKEAWIAFAAAAYPQMSGTKTVATIADTMLANFKQRFPK